MDVGFLVASLREGLGMALRDSHGHLLLSAAISITHCVSVDLAESWALHYGLSLALDAGFRPLLLETDLMRCFYGPT